MRLNKYIAESGFCSRRKADSLIENGSVKINGNIAKLGDQVGGRDKVSINGQVLTPKNEDIFIVLNKPYGVICTKDKDAKDTIYDYVKSDDRLLYAGRLDVESSGLVLLTNNGDIINKITRPSSNHEKEYVVTVDKEMTRKFIDSMANGVMLDGSKTKPAKVRKLTDTKFNIVLTEGRNRQIRRMCASLGYEATSLKRVRIMNIKLGQLGVGNSRPLTKTERRELLSALK
jgi:23S rRNA pseudouridine2604 synthase